MTSEEQQAKEALDKASAANKEADEATAKAIKANEQQDAADRQAEIDAKLKEPVIIHGREGMAFSIDGPGLGSKGILLISGRMIPTTRWDDRSIRGIMPVGVRGPIRLQTETGERFGVFPTPPPNLVVTKTTTIEQTVVPAGSTLPAPTPATTTTTTK